jgi:hypothetical protein
MESSERSLLRLFIGVLAFYDFQQFLSQNGANTRAALGGEGASSFQEGFVHCESDVLLHEPAIPVYT